MAFKTVAFMVRSFKCHAVKGAGRQNPSFPTAALSVSGIEGLSHRFPIFGNGPLAAAVKLMEIWNNCKSVMIF